MALVMLPGLSALIEDISEEKKLPANVVEAALREALLKGYERYRRTLYIGISEDPFDEEYFSNFDVGLDLDEEGYRVLASKIIVEEVESEDHQIGLVEVQQVTDDAQLGDTVVLDVTPEKDDFGRMAAATTKQVLAQKLREHQRRMIQEEFADLEDPVLTARVIRFERQSVIMAVSSGLGRPEVEAELPRRDQLPNDNYRANATFKVFLKEVSEIARRGPQLFISRANAGLVVISLKTKSLRSKKDPCGSWPLPVKPTRHRALLAPAPRWPSTALSGKSIRLALALARGAPGFSRWSTSCAARRSM